MLAPGHGVMRLPGGVAGRPAFQPAAARAAPAAPRPRPGQGKGPATAPPGSRCRGVARMAPGNRHSIGLAAANGGMDGLRTSGGAGRRKSAGPGGISVRNGSSSAACGQSDRSATDDERREDP
jgi:hypothetical protein